MIQNSSRTIAQRKTFNELLGRDEPQHGLSRETSQPVIQRVISPNASQTKEDEQWDKMEDDKKGGRITNFLNKIVEQAKVNNQKSPGTKWEDLYFERISAIREPYGKKDWQTVIEKTDELIEIVNKWEKQESLSVATTRSLQLDNSRSITSKTKLKDSKGVDHDFAHRYEGPDANQYHWIQFVWLEVHIQKPGENPVPIVGSVRGNIGTVEYTTDPQHRKIVVDAVKDAERPYYEDRGTSDKTDTMLEMQDTPTALRVLKPNDAQMYLQDTPVDTTLTSKLHFTSFLLHNTRTVAQSDIDITHQWQHVILGNSNIQTFQQTINNQIDIGPQIRVTQMPPEYRLTLTERFPDIDVDGQKARINYYRKLGILK